MNEVTNFENVKIGDKIVYRYGSTWHSSVVLTSVIKVTAKQFVDEYATKFRKADGSVVGNGFRKARYATDEDLAIVAEKEKRRSLSDRIKDFAGNWNSMQEVSIEDLETICEIIKKYE